MIERFSVFLVVVCISFFSCLVGISPLCLKGNASRLKVSSLFAKNLLNDWSKILGQSVEQVFEQVPSVFPVIVEDSTRFLTDITPPISAGQTVTPTLKGFAVSILAKIFTFLKEFQTLSLVKS